METIQAQKQINPLALPGLSKKNGKKHADAENFENLLYPELKKIGKLVAEYYKISFKKMKEKRRFRVIVQPRQTAMTLSMLLTKYSTTRIGSFFGGFDHATVLHAEKSVNNLFDTDAKFRKDYNFLLREVNNMLSEIEEESMYTYNIDHENKTVEIRTNAYFNYESFKELTNNLIREDIDNQYTIEML
jgi:chromosomal replication initiator protein